MASAPHQQRSEADRRGRSVSRPLGKSGCRSHPPQVMCRPSADGAVQGAEVLHVARGVAAGRLRRGGPRHVPVPAGREIERVHKKSRAVKVLLTLRIWWPSSNLAPGHSTTILDESAWPGQATPESPRGIDGDVLSKRLRTTQYLNRH